VALIVAVRLGLADWSRACDDLSAASSATSYSVLLESCLREWIFGDRWAVATIHRVVILVGLVQTRGVVFRWSRSLEPDAVSFFARRLMGL